MQHENMIPHMLRERMGPSAGQTLSPTRVETVPSKDGRSPCLETRRDPLRYVVSGCYHYRAPGARRLMARGYCMCLACLARSLVPLTTYNVTPRCRLGVP